MKAVTRKKTTVGKIKSDGLAPLIAEVRTLIQSARHTAAAAVNTLQVRTNFEIGRRIVEHEQKGEKRAGYGQELLKTLSTKLTEEFGKGFSKANLEYMRRFYLEWGQQGSQIAQTPSGQFIADRIPQIVSGQSIPSASVGLSPESTQRKGQTASDLLPLADIRRNVSRSSFTLSWSHYVLLLTIRDPDERSFYEIEAVSENWSLNELKRQKSSALYERLALSRDKKKIKKLAEEGQRIACPEDVLKEPYVLEFLGLDEKSSYSETELESAIITHVEKFLLELGKGFLFEARQKRFTFDEDHFFVDLVFYNRLLRCYVLIDLKLEKLTHQDLGQMQMYMNYYDRYVKLKEENPTIGLLLCKEKKDAVVELTLPKDANIHAREYKLYLPSKELLKAKLLEWTREEEGKR